MTDALADAVEDAVALGDTDAVRDLLAPLTDAQRRALRPVGARHRFDHNGVTSWPAYCAARYGALLGTATARACAGRRSRHIGTLGPAHAAIVEARGTEFATRLVAALQRSDGSAYWSILRPLVARGVVPRPAGTDYAESLAIHLGDWHPGWETDADWVAARSADLRSDPETLAELVDLLFGFDTSCPYPELVAHLAGTGDIDRTATLDATLAGFQSDFSKVRNKWLAKVHELLDPTPAEIAPRAGEYIQLLLSAHPVVIKVGLASLGRIEVPDYQLAAMVAAPIGHPQKNIAIPALDLTARSASRSPAARDKLVDALTVGLSHERRDVREHARRLLEAQGWSEPSTIMAAPAHTGAWPVPRMPEMTAEKLAGMPAVWPVGSVDELIELTAIVQEDAGSADDLERVLDGISRLCASERDDEISFARRTRHLLTHPEDTMGATVLSTLLRSWIKGTEPSEERRFRRIGHADAIAGFRWRRSIEIARRAARRDPAPLMALPTHQNGWIDPAELKLRLVQNPFREPFDLAQARARVPGPPSIKLAWEITEAGVAFNQLAGPSDDPVTLHALWDIRGGFFRENCREVAEMLPRESDVVCAHAARALRRAIDSYRVDDAPDEVLGWACSPDVRLGDIAWLTTAMAFLSLQAEMSRAAVDLTLQAIDDGRADPTAVGRRLAELINHHVGSCGRLAAPLRDLRQSGEPGAAFVHQAVTTFIAEVQGLPTGLHVPLEEISEAGSLLGIAVDQPAAQAALQRISAETGRGSKTGRYAALLANSAAG